MPLGEEDLQWITRLLRPIAHKWKEVVMRLGVKNDHIMSMMESSKDGAVLLNMGMSKWLQQEATLTALAETLSSPEIGEPYLASEIMKGKRKALITIHPLSVTSCLFVCGFLPLSVCLVGLQRKKEKSEVRESSGNLSDVKYPSLPPLSENGACSTTPIGIYVVCFKCTMLHTVMCV